MPESVTPHALSPLNRSPLGYRAPVAEFDRVRADAPRSSRVPATHTVSPYVSLGLGYVFTVIMTSEVSSPGRGAFKATRARQPQESLVSGRSRGMAGYALALRAADGLQRRVERGFEHGNGNARSGLMQRKLASVLARRGLTKVARRVLSIFAAS
jgi:hypothetical protein